MFSEQDHVWMQHALQLAREAESLGEVPVGAVLVMDGQMIGEGCNRSILQCDPTAHAEVIALRQGAKQMHNYRLVDSTLYVTLEPCVMCIGAIVHARVKRLVFGAYDPKAGAITSASQIIDANKLNHRVVCEGGLLREECGKVLSDFFRARR
jgi:tRNA(adenine34) deaminase